MKPCIEKEIEALESDFKTFKNTHNERITMMEKKVDTQNIQEKVQDLSTRIDQVNTTLKTLTLSSERPHLESITRQNNLQTKALSAYILNGQDAGLLAIEHKALGINPDEAGLFLPEHIVDLVQEELSAACPLRLLAEIVRTSRPKYEILSPESKVMQTVWGYDDYLSFAIKGTDTPKIRKLTFPLHVMWASPLIARELIEDSAMNIEKWIVQEITRCMAATQSISFIHGDGKNQPQGLLNAHFSQKEEAHAIQNWIIPEEKIDASYFIDMAHSLRAEYRSGACWLMSRQALTCVRNLRSKEGGPFLISFSEGTPQIMGYPVTICDDLPEPANSKKLPSIFFGNFKRGYVIIDRGDVRILRDPYTAKPHTMLNISLWVGGGIKDHQALKAMSIIKNT